MATISAPDGCRLYVEETGEGEPILFLHEFAGDHRSWEPQVRHFSRAHRCITFAARGYLPSDVPEEASRYSQEAALADAMAILDELKIEKAHIVGHSMGAYTALHIGLRYPDRCLSVSALGCGWGSTPGMREEAAKSCDSIAELFRENSITEAAAVYARFPMRKTFEAKDPRGFAEFEGMLAEHSAQGSINTMLGLQKMRPTLLDMEEDLKSFVPPLLVVLGDEDHPCIDGSLLLKRTVPTAALAMIPRAGHTITTEEPAAVNAELEAVFAAVAQGSWMCHREAPEA
ncbi:Pimeloyl-ACP methyl ester carboxylesterase [Monaibacterium marinum]|uniref:Pimeloyl-ACP methyl ester carboxylesterase n=1 Tax=Pontivivens marinum TaxID=1690039 RepID=A0A2C9CTW0_9RHOB|nr:alpha/beta hydrolase [Monaibacterium marinum]SOH94951.1 Pimeloyl-ACP methyl ester carboxylesterase [Monaibacterium marinum]